MVLRQGICMWIGMWWEDSPILDRVTTYTTLRPQWIPGASQTPSYDTMITGSTSTIPHLSFGTQSQGGNGQLSTTSVVWSFYDHSGSNRYGGLYYSRTDAILQNFYLHNKCSHMIEFGMDTLADSERDPCVGCPVVYSKKRRF